MAEDTVKTRAQSTRGLAAIKAGLVKSKLESGRSRTQDGTPISYSAIKSDLTKVEITSRNLRESRSFSDPDISGKLVIFTEANGLFSKANKASSFKGTREVNPNQLSAEMPVFMTSEDNQGNESVKKMTSSFEKLSTELDSKHMVEFSNPLHRGNQPRFRKGGGVLPAKPPIAPKPVVPPKPPVFNKSTAKIVTQQSDKTIPNKDNVLMTPSKQSYNYDEDEDMYAKVLHEKPSIPTRPPPRKLPNKTTDNKDPETVTCTTRKESIEQQEELQQENEKENETITSEPAPLYAQVDKTKKRSYLKNVNLDREVVGKRDRSESDPSPLDVSMVSGMKFEVIEEEPNVKQSTLENEDEVISEADSEEGWDPNDFDDDDSSDFDDDNSRTSSQGEIMQCPDQKLSKKLHNIALEILTTERAYVKRLHLLDKVFYFRLQNECLAHGHITPDVLQDIFSNISSIHLFHKDFLLPKLEERMSKWSTDNRIGDILKTLAPFLKLYTAYIANFDKSSETLSTWTKKSPKFASIIEEIQKSKECENLTLGHHMLEPIQRVPRYKLLLRDYLGKLPEDSLDYKDTQDAMEIISEAAAHANDSMKKTERFKKLLELQERVSEDYDLITAGRQFIKEGDLTKVAARHVAHQERTLLLFNDVLLCCAKLPGTNKLKVKVEMDLYGMEIGDADEDVELSNTFRVTSKQKVIDFSAPSEEERKKWIQSINDAIQEMSRKRESYKRGSQPNAISDRELGKKAPAWVRDESVTMCMSCDILFTLTRRRHHCRACGAIFCNACSRPKAQLEYSGKVERVCETCHKILVKGAKASVVKKSVEEKRHQDVRKISRDSKVILSGYLGYKSGKGWVKRWCVLSNTFEFYCYKAKKDQKADFSLPLPGYVVDKPNMADNLDKKIAFKLHHKNVVVYYFASDNQELLDRWMHNLSYAVKAERIPEEETVESETPTTQT